MPRLPKLLEGLWVAALCALAMFLTWDHARGDAATNDEPVHLYAGAESVLAGVLFTNPEHPPLAKLLAGLSLLRRNVRPPSVLPQQPVQAMTSFFRENVIPLNEILALGRAPFQWLLALLIVAVYFAARTAFGIPAAMLASALIALDPNFIAHAGVVHTDLAATLFMTLTVILAITSGVSPKRWLLTGLALGLAIATKFTALLLLPLVLLAPLLVREQLKERFAGALAACIVAGLVVYVVYAWTMRATHPDDAAFVAARFLKSRKADPATIARYARLTQSAPEVGMFLTGVKGVQLFSSGSRGWNYLHGRVCREGFPRYFFVAFLMKSTPAMLLVTLAIVAARKRDRWTLGLLAPVALLFVASIPSSFNIGVRHILPVYPLLAIAGAGALASRLPRRAFVITAAILVASAGVSVATIHPLELGYFNFMGGPEWLSDSNVDWGQDIDRLHAFLRERGWERDTTVIVLAVPGIHDVERYRGPELGAVRPGRYATSTFVEHLGPHVAGDLEGPAAQASMQQLLDTLRSRGRKIARVGASITIWELR